MRNALISAILFILSTLYLLFVKHGYSGWEFANWYDPYAVTFMLLLISPAITLWGAATLYLCKALRDFCTWAEGVLHSLLDKALDVFSEVDHPSL